MKTFIKIITAILPVASWRKKSRDVLLRGCVTIPHRIRGVRFGGRFVLHGAMHATVFCCFAFNVHVNDLHVKGMGELTVGAHTHFGREVLEISSSHDYKGTKLPYDSRHVVKPVKIGACVWIGDRCTRSGTGSSCRLPKNTWHDYFFADFSGDGRRGGLRSRFRS